MKLLIADDEAISRKMLQATLTRSGFQVVVATNGEEALQTLEGDDPPRLAILDWMMPGLDGIDVCRRLRKREDGDYFYVILLTARGQKNDIVTGLDAGADDYLTKPFDPQELRSRLSVGQRILNLQQDLRTKVEELQEAMRHVTTLQHLMPICMHCKSIRDDKATWHRLETYLEEHSGAMFTHSLCQDCLAQHYPQFEKKVLAKTEE